MKFKKIAKWAGVTTALMLASNVVAYEQIDVKNGGTISGKISFSGALPANPSLEITKDKDTCGSSKKADYYLGSGGGLQNVVVAIESIDKGKKFKKRAIIPFNNKKCMFVPHVTTAVKGQKLGINNSDPVLHNTHLYHSKKLKTMYNIALPLMNKVIKKPLRKLGVVTVKCDAHEWMLGYVYVSKNPYSTVTASNGSFSIGDVPAGNYKVKIWHEKLGEVSQDVTVAAGGTAKLNYSFSK